MFLGFLIYILFSDSEYDIKTVKSNTIFSAPVQRVVVARLYEEIFNIKLPEIVTPLKKKKMPS